jgi:tetratricopeptide (TPR) repeat protein
MILIFVLGAAAYSNTFSSPFMFDDTATLYSPVIQELSFSSLMQAFESRRAIGLITFQLNHFFFGWNVASYHLINILIHLAASLTIYKLLQLLMQTPCMIETADDRLRSLPLPFLAALLFAVHPVQTQAVTYIVQRFASLATLFYLAAIVAYLKARLRQNISQTPLSFGVIGWFAACTILVFMAFYTKEIAYTLPLAILLVELLFFRSSWQKICWLIATGSAAVVAILLKYFSAAQSIQNAMSALDDATRVHTIISRTDYLFTQFRVIWVYIRLLFLPVKQRLDYDYVLSHSFDLWVFSSFLGIMALLLAAFWLLKKSSAGYPHFRLIAFGILWFFLTLLVESSIIPIIDLIFEHRLYLPAFGIITAVVTAVMLFAWRGTVVSKEVACSGFLLVSLVFAIATYNRNSVWSSEVSLWTDNVAKSPKSARAWHHLGAAFIKERAPLDSLKATIRSIELNRSGPEAWNNLGIALDLFGAYNDRFNRTVEMFREPEAINEQNTSRWQGEVNNNLGLAYEIIGNLDKAAENYRNAIGYNPSLGLAYYNLGIVSAKMGDVAKYSEQQQILWMLDPVLAERLQLRVGKR